MIHESWDDLVNKLHDETKDAPGVDIRQMDVGSEIFIKTQHYTFRLYRGPDDQYFLSGHPGYCLTPTKVRISGSTWGGTTLKMAWVGVGMFMEFKLETHTQVMLTPVVLDVF